MGREACTDPRCQLLYQVKDSLFTVAHHHGIMRSVAVDASVFVETFLSATAEKSGQEVKIQDVFDKSIKDFVGRLVAIAKSDILDYFSVCICFIYSLLDTAKRECHSQGG